MEMKRKEDKRSSIMIKKDSNVRTAEPVVKQGWKQALGQVLQFVSVGGDFV
jgi:hypothetical protein